MSGEHQWFFIADGAYPDTTPCSPYSAMSKPVLVCNNAHRAYPWVAHLYVDQNPQFKGYAYGVDIDGVRYTWLSPHHDIERIQKPTQWRYFDQLDAEIARLREQIDCGAPSIDECKGRAGNPGKFCCKHDAEHWRRSADQHLTQAMENGAAANELRDQLAEAVGYGSRFLTNASPGIEPLDTPAHIMTQMDNLYAGLRQRAESAEAERDDKQARLDASPHAEVCGINTCQDCRRDESNWRHSKHAFQPGECTPNCHKHESWNADTALSKLLQVTQDDIDRADRELGDGD